MKKYIIINMARLHKNKLSFWKQSVHGYSQCLSWAGIFNDLDISKMHLEPEDIKIEISNEINIIGLSSEDIELAKKMKYNSIAEMTIDLDAEYNCKRVIEILRELRNKE